MHGTCIKIKKKYKLSSSLVGDVVLTCATQRHRRVKISTTTVTVCLTCPTLVATNFVARKHISLSRNI